MSTPHYTKQLILIVQFLIVSLSLIQPSRAPGSEWGPWDRDKSYTKLEENIQKADQDRNLLRSITTFPGIVLISFFQTVVSPVDGATCDFYPTCSAYAKQAIRKHGLFLGLIMASERLCRYHAPEGYEPIVKYGRYYIYDPVENNDFWFHTGKAFTP